MAAVERKSVIPVKDTTVVPYNNGATYTTGTVIQILFGRGDVNNWLVQDSFFQFNYKITLPAGTDPCYIRSIHQLFDWVEVVYQGQQVYIQNFNQQAKFLDYLCNGGDYLDSEIYSYITSKNLSYGRLKLVAGVNNITGCIMRVGELFNIFSQVLEIPMSLLDNQIQLNFHLADPRTYLVHATPDSTVSGLYDFQPVAQTLAFSDFSLERFEFHIKDKIELSPAFSPDKTMKFDYTMQQIALRGIEASDFPANSTLNLPFSIVTENVENMGIYFYRNGYPTLAYRPELINVNFKYGNNTSPFSPINVDSYSSPGTYKTINNDTMDISTAIFNTTNFDYDMSYRYLPMGTTDANVGKEDCHILLTTDFVTSGDLLGAPSKEWNSQYIFQANASGKGLPQCTACMWVKSKYLATISEGKLRSVNI